MMTILTPSSWTTFLDCVGSMKTSWLLPHTPLWVSHSSAHLHKSIDTTMNGKHQALDLFVILHLNLRTTILMTITTWCHPLHGLSDIFLLTQAHEHVPNPTYNSHIDHGLVHKAQWTMLTIPWDHLIPLGVSSTLCVKYSLFIKMMSWRYTWMFTQSSLLLLQDMLAISSILTWPIFG